MDASDNIYLTGKAYSGGSTNAPVDAYVSGSTNSVIYKIDSSGSYQWHTFHPTGTSQSPWLAVDSCGDVYLSGPSGPAWTSPTGGAPLSPHTLSSRNIYVLKLNIDGQYLWHTFFAVGHYHPESPPSTPTAERATLPSS